MSTWQALKIIFGGKSFAWRFALGVIVGLAFSMMATWAALGIMDSFEEVFYQALRAGSGEFILKSPRGHFAWGGQEESKIKKLQLKAAPMLRTEAFLTVGAEAQGVLVMGINDLAQTISPLLPPLAPGEIAVGTKLAQKYHLQVGDHVVLTFGRGTGNHGLPFQESFKIQRIVAHHIYLRDMRQVYLNLNELQQILGSARVNLVMLESLVPLTKTARTDLIGQIFYTFDFKLNVMPFWHEFGNLLKAVQTEKVLLGLALQLIVLIAAFNVLAFIWFLYGQSAPEIFLLQALGLSRRKVARTWDVLTVGLWAVGGVVGLGMLEGFKLFLGHYWPKLMPADIYHLDAFTLHLTSFDYWIVPAAALGWMILVVKIGGLKMRRRSLLYGLRREFN